MVKMQIVFLATLLWLVNAQRPADEFDEMSRVKFEMMKKMTEESSTGHPVVVFENTK